MLDIIYLLFDNEQDDPLLGQTVERLDRLARESEAHVIIASRSTPRFMKLVSSEPLRGLSAADKDALLCAPEVDLPADIRTTLYERTEGNAELLMLAIQALRRAADPVKVVARLATADDIEGYLTVEVDEGLTETDRAVMNGMATLLGLPATRDAIEETLARSRLRQTLIDLTNR